MRKEPLIPYFILLLVLVLAPFLSANAQQYEVTGVVTDEYGESLPGVTILVKGTTQGTITDIDGKYHIAVMPEQILVFRFVGMREKEVAVSGQRIINVSLEASLHDLAEVQVVAYGQQSRLTVTGAISSVTTDDLVKSPSASVANSLAGKVTGFSSVQFSGQPGADDPTIYVRGIASLSEERSRPLMIVDGVERSFMQLDPNEIESISVLKDASATAVYGVRGANGVIIVTTKRGQEGPARINATFSSGIQQATRLLEFADSYTYAMRLNEALLNDNPNLTPEQLRFSPQAIEAFRTGSDPIMYPNMNWMDYILKPSTMQSQGNVNIRGGSGRVNYFTSLGFLNQDGLFRTFDTGYNNNFAYNRYNYRSNIDIRVTETTKLGITTGGRVGVRNQPNAKDGMDQLFRLIYWAVPFSGPGIVDGKYIRVNNDYIPEQKSDALDAYHGRGFTNILNNNLNFDLDLNQDLKALTNGLTFRSKFSYNSSYTHTKVRNSSVAYYEPYYLKDVDPAASPDDHSVVFRKMGTDGNLTYGENFGKGRNWYFDAGFDYKRRIGLHNIGALALYNHSRVYYPAQWSDIPTGLVGLVGRVTYDYNTKYQFDFNIGYNGSENFIREKRYGLFPAASAGWILTEEAFLSSVPHLDFLKLRASYGMVGNDQIGGARFLYLPDSYIPWQGGYSFGTDNPTNRPRAREGQIGNPDVTWETAIKQNFGVDLIMLKDLRINFDYFVENRKNILAYRGTVPAFVAYSLPAVNIGEVRNEGFEVDLKWGQRIQPGVRYWINANLSHAKNRIVFMDEVPQNETYLYRTGHPVGQPFGFVFDRFFNESDIDNPAIPNHQYALKPGDMVYRDLNGDGVIDHNDQMAIGYPNYPGFAFGTNMGFEFKGFDISMSWAGATNTSRMLDETFRVPFGHTSNRSLLQYMADNRWTAETAETATFPRLTILGRQNNSRDSDFFLRDASYLRLKNLELGYNFTGNTLKRLGTKNLRVYLNGYNLLTFDRLKVADPESRTGSRPVYPLTKVYNMGVRANF